MAISYRAVGWNRQKRIYDSLLWLGIIAYLVVFLAIDAAFNPNATAETSIIRAFGTAAFLLLHLILCIGPAARLDARFLPLLFNRRHMGVSMFVLALGHGALAVLQFHAFGDLNPVASIFLANGNYMSLSEFPFQTLGFVALVILFLMAATSHDFWLANLTAPVWKTLHMLVYVAYGLLLAHVALGILQAEFHPALAALVLIGACLVFGLHLASAWKGRSGDRPAALDEDGWVEVGPVQAIPENRARIVNVAGERVAVFRYGEKVSAVSNVCQHQNGPLGEGEIIDGCITCPWHGYQYNPEDGDSPPPFTEKVPTFDLRMKGGIVFVSSQPNPAGTPVKPLAVPPRGDAS